MLRMNWNFPEFLSFVVFVFISIFCLDCFWLVQVPLSDCHQNRGKNLAESQQPDTVISSEVPGITTQTDIVISGYFWERGTQTDISGWCIDSVVHQLSEARTTIAKLQEELCLQQSVISKLESECNALGAMQQEAESQLHTLRYTVAKLGHDCPLFRRPRSDTMR